MSLVSGAVKSSRIPILFSLQNLREIVRPQKLSAVNHLSLQIIQSSEIHGQFVKDFSTVSNKNTFGFFALGANDRGYGHVADWRAYTLSHYDEVNAGDESPKYYRLGYCT